jgi:glutamyl-tRNA synthetase
VSFSDQEISLIARKYALLNAVEHDGKADQGSVVGRILAENAALRKDAARVKAIVSTTVSAVNSSSVNDQKKALSIEYPGEFEKQLAKRKEVSKADSQRQVSLPDLPRAKQGFVVTRFPPEPNGYMHIGHAKAAIIGYEYSKKYDGKFILRFDDTNPAAEKKEFYDAFTDALGWLDIKPDLVKKASDDMPKFYEFAEKMIKSRGAYVCTCSQEVMRLNRSEGVACSHRTQPTDANLTIWHDMVSGKVDRKNATLRFVGDVESLNTTMRDPVLFRIVEEPHPLKGSEYSVWPTYDFDGPVEDSLDGVTHAMRSKEYELRDELYFAILDSLGLRKPEIIEFSRLDLQNTTVSKRSLKKLIEEKKIDSWDDPRLPTIAGLKRRGFLPEAIKEFILSMGVSKVESQPTWDLLESINRKLLDPIAKRYFFVSEPWRLLAKDAPKLDISLRFHPEKDYGERTIATDGQFLISGSDARQLSRGSVLRLIEAYNVEVLSVGEGEISAKYLGDQKLDKVPRIQWVSPNAHEPLKVLVPGPLLLNDVFNPDSLQVIDGLIESSGGKLVVGEIFQLVRFGFSRLDSPGTAILAHK